MNEQVKIITLSAIGLDSPGLVSKITSRIFELKGNIIDVEEGCRRGLFSIFLIIDFGASRQSMTEITETLSAIGGESGLKVLVQAYDEQEIIYHLSVQKGKPYCDHPGGRPAWDNLQGFGFFPPSKHQY